MRFVHHLTLSATLALRAWQTPVCLGTNAIVEDKDGRVVLVRHRYMPGLCFPGGGIHYGEAPVDAVQRELAEELGMRHVATVELFSLYTRNVGRTTNLIALYRMRDAEFEFKPNLEISDIARIDPHAPPPDTSPAARRRLEEFVGLAPVSPYW